MAKTKVQRAGPPVRRSERASVSRKLPWYKQESSPWRLLLISAFIFAVGFWIYWPALNGAFLWDDNMLISDNSVTHDPYGIVDIWFRPAALLDFFPFTSTLYWLQWQLWGANTLGYHLVDVTLHLVGALLVWRLFAKLGMRFAWIGGLIFAVHPLMVESVAWMSELKNTLSTPPFLLALCAWIDFRDRRREEDYWLSVFLFLIAMLCKPSMIMFPFVTILYAWWQTGRVAWADIWRTIPLFVIGGAIALLVTWFEHFGVGGQPLPIGGFWSRTAVSGLAISFYFSKFFLPIQLLPMYPQWPINPPTLIQFLPWPIMAAVAWYLWTKRDTWGRHVLLGLGFFLFNLILFVGFRPITFMRFSWVMDHLAYLPSLGLIGLVTAGIGHFASLLKERQRMYASWTLAGLMAVLAISSHQYAKLYVDLEALWSYTVRISPESWIAHNDLAYAYIQQGRLQEAKEQLEEALAINPMYAEARNNLGIILENLGDESGALQQFQESLQIDPSQPNTQANLKLMLSHQKPPPASPANGAGN